jgi:hypothetical protein
VSASVSVSLIFEINQFVGRDEVGNGDGGGDDSGNGSGEGDDEGARAALYHLRDLVETDVDGGTGTDVLDSTMRPGRVRMRTPSLQSREAWRVDGTVGTEDGAVNSTKLHLLLVRLPDYDVDLCVVVNVVVTIAGAGGGRDGRRRGKDGEKEEHEGDRVAETIMEKVVDSLEVRDFGLFRPEG